MPKICHRFQPIISWMVMNMCACMGIVMHITRFHKDPTKFFSLFLDIIFSLQHLYISFESTTQKTEFVLLASIIIVIVIYLLLFHWSLKFNNEWTNGYLTAHNRYQPQKANLCSIKIITLMAIYALNKMLLFQLFVSEFFSWW